MQELQKQNHLFWRAGFGPTPEMLFQSTPFHPGKYFNALLQASSRPPVPFRIVQDVFDGLGNGIGEIGRMQNRIEGDSASAAETRRLNQQRTRQEIRSLNLTWLEEMVHSPAQLREKMALFWHGHFACRNLNSFYQQQLINIIREHALGNFGTLLSEVSKSAAMLQFLNNQQNRKNSPNENFAREVMELFTLGRGFYTEQDVKEAARAFTGWGFNLQGQFQFRPILHDNGQKEVLGKTGNLYGEDVLKILLDQKQTARFICTKLYRFLVNDNVNSKHVDWLAERFYHGGYEIIPLLTDLFTADWFYAPEQVGTHIKSPVELLVGLRRQLPMEIGNQEVQILLQRAMGQILFFPPNVSGWQGGKSWIDSTTLLLRMRLPQLLASQEGLDLQVKTDDDTEMGMGRRASVNLSRFNLTTSIDWKSVLIPFEKIPEQSRYEKLAASLLQTSRLPQFSFIKELTGGETDARRLTLTLMSLPEYQLS